MKQEKIKKAAALKYEARKDRAPRLTAKGSGQVAERIIELARQERIPIREDANLVGALMQLDLEKEIPVELYKVVAEVLAFVYRLNQKKMKS